jgi:hypothetical protein
MDNPEKKTVSVLHKKVLHISAIEIIVFKCGSNKQTVNSTEFYQST